VNSERNSGVGAGHPAMIVFMTTMSLHTMSVILLSIGSARKCERGSDYGEACTVEVMSVKIGARLRVERIGRNLSQADIERRCGLPRCRISWLENGRVVPTIETLEKLCGALEIPLYKLFRDVEEPAEVSTASKRSVAKGRARSDRAGHRRFLEKLGQDVRSLCEDDQNLLLYIARALAKRGFRRSSRERRHGRGN